MTWVDGYQFGEDLDDLRTDPVWADQLARELAAELSSGHPLLGQAWVIVAKARCGRLVGPVICRGWLRARARDKATTADLWYVAEFPGPVDEFRAPDSLLNRAAPETAEFAYRHNGHPGRSDWPFFRAAVHEVWQALRPLL